MSGQTFTVGELAEALAGGDERATRGLLCYDGGAAHLDVYAQDPAETVDRDVVIRLVAQRAGDRVGRKAAELLSKAEGGDSGNPTD